jgi:hypothetical protein
MHSFIGADSLSYLGHLMNCKHNRVLEGVTLLLAPAQTAS